VCRTCGTDPLIVAARPIPSGGAAPSALKSRTVATAKSTKKQIGGVVRIHVQEAHGIAAKGIVYPIGELIERTRVKLGEYGITLQVESRLRPQTILYSGDVILDEDKEDIYRASLQHFPANDKIYRVIICSLGKSNSFGETFPNFIVDGKVVPKFTLLNANLVDNSSVTLLHEMIHASKKRPHNHDPERDSVFFKHAKEAGRVVDDDFVTQSLFKEEHAESIAHSFFGIGAR
jgi:hypothetical protein